MSYQKTEVRAIDHIGITVPDLDAAATFLEKAFGATAIYDNIIPTDPPQQGEGNSFMYAVTTWGTLVELISYPSSLEIEKTTPLRRWKPQKGRNEA